MISARQLMVKIMGGILVLFSLVVEAYGVNLANNSSFECGLDVGYGHDGIVVKDDTTAYHGKSSMRIDTPDLFEIMSDDIQLKPNTQYRFSVWAKASEGSDRTVVMRLSSSETTPWAHNIIMFTPTTEWAQYSSDYYSVVVDPLSQFILVPEKNKNFRIWFENKGGTTGTTVWIDAVEVEEITGDVNYTPPPFEVGIEKTSTKYYTYLGVAYPVNFLVRNNTSLSKTLQVNYRVLDEYFNKEVKSGMLDITAEANSTTAMMLANLAPDRRGKYIVYSDLLDGGTIISSSTFEFAVIEKVMKGESQFTDGFTVCGHSGGRALGAGTDEEVYDFRAEAGDRWIRDRDGIILKWNSIEPAEGEFIWTDFDNFLNEATKRGIRILPNLGSGCNYAQPDVPPNLPAWLANDTRSQIVYNGTKKVYLFPIREWRNFVRACVTRYKGRITHWEILNEPGSYLTPEQYVSYLQAAFEEIKAADPAAKVIGICETQQGNTTTQFLKNCFNNVPSAVNYCDIISFHGYRARLDGTVFSAPQISAEKGISDMKAVMNTYGAENKELWMTELYYIGQPIVINGVNVDYPFQWDIKGHEPARRFLIDLANGISKSFCVRANYYTKHWAPKSWNDRPVGLVPSRWFVIYNTLAKLFESSTFVKQVLNTGFATEYLKLYIYDKSGVPIAATWHYSDTGTFTSLEFPGASGKIKILDIMGNQAFTGEVKQIGDKMVLPQVGNTPYYIVPDNGTTSDEFINLMSASGIADDKSPPVCSISINNDSQYTSIPGVTLNLSATDNFGVAGYYISLDSTVPSATATGWISVTKTANYNGNIPYTLSSGDGIKKVYVWCKDAAGNVSNTASDTIDVDSIVPVVSITSPSSAITYTTTDSTISLGGGVADDGSGITSVTWSSDKGESGTANGTTNWTISDISLTDGDTVITVTATDSAGNTGTDTITITYGKAPTAITVSESNVTSDSATLSGTVNAGGLSTTVWFDYGTTSGLYDNTTPVQNVNGSTDAPLNADIIGLLQGKTYYYRVGARNRVGAVYGNEKTFKTLDTAAPMGTIVIKGGDAYTNTALVTLGLSATDIAGVIGYYLSFSDVIPSAIDTGWVAVEPVTTYTGTVSYTLSSGDGNKTMYVWYKDNAGNISTTASDSIDVDTTAPVVAIMSPTSDAIYTTTDSMISLGGGVADDESGITSVTWSSDKGEGGTANGTTSWTIPDISLTDGDTVITVTATDSAGNTGTDTITITYGKAPTAITVSESNVTSDSATLSGTVNAGGLSTTVWFDYGTTNGLYDNTTPVQNVNGSTDAPLNADIIGLLQGKTYYYRVGARNRVGTVYGNEKTFKTLDTAAPVGTIVIKGGDAYTNSAQVTLGLSATDNAGITGYYLSLSDVVPSGAAEGWVAVTSAPGYSKTVSYTLSSGEGGKTVYVWYKDDAGNISGMASDSIVVDTTAPVITITSPSPAATYTATASTINLGGSVAEDGSGVSGVVWSSDKGGSGTASGTMSWTISDITLTSGNIVITVTATDAAGNTGKDTITVSYSGVPAQTGLSALYAFDEGSGLTALDTSGNGNNGTINGATWTNGKSGGGLSFNGTNNYVTISNSLPPFSEFTCAAWVQVADLSANRGVFTSGGLNTSGFRFRVNKDGSVWLMVAGGGSYNTVLTAAGVIQSGPFYHISVTGMSGQYMRIYVNGALAKEKITTQTITTPTASGYIGTSWSTTSELMKGVIDDVRIYKRALSNQEVLDLYNKNNALPSSGVPVGSISINNGNAYTNSPAVLLNLSATDNVGVVGYYLSSNDMTPSSADIGWVAVTSAPGYSETVSHTLSSGEGSKTVYVWYKDSDGNISSTASDSIVVDTTAPVVAITTPTSVATYTATASTINLGGSISENGSGVSGVVWSSDKGGSGTASGTMSWTISNINLTVGNTVITVMATDGEGNTGKDTITVGYSGTSTPAGINALYTFNEGSGATANDTSGKGNNGVINGATWTTGKIKGGLKFNGTSSYVSIPRMNFDEVSVSAWFYKNAKDTINVDAITGGWYWSSNAQLHEGFDVRFSPAAPDTLEFVLVTKNAGGTRVLKTAKYNLVNSVGSWFHVVCVYSKGTGEQMLYVNGQLVNTQTHPPGNTVVPLTNYSDMRIGHSRVNKGFFNGTLDEVRFYNRALSNQEVIDLYNVQ